MEAQPAALIRTFKTRRGRLATGRRQALDELLPRYGVAVTGGRLDPAAEFSRCAPLVLEIGFGMGEHPARAAGADPDRDYLAAEVHVPGVANLLRLVNASELTNLRVAHGDGLTLLRDRIAPGSLAAIHAYFPDPWPKTRHHKRRLFQPAHIALLRDRLAPDGTLHTATDVPEYATAIRSGLAADPGLGNLYEGWAPPPAYRPRTGYERRALAAGRPIFDLVFRRLPAGPAVGKNEA